MDSGVEADLELLAGLSFGEDWAEALVWVLVLGMEDKGRRQRKLDSLDSEGRNKQPDSLDSEETVSNVRTFPRKPDFLVRT